MLHACVAAAVQKAARPAEGAQGELGRVLGVDGVATHRFAGADP